MEKILQEYYEKEKYSIKRHLETYRKNSEQEKLQEFLFCLLTPQSNAERCWEAVTLIPSAKSYAELQEILKTRTRFYRTKASRVVDAFLLWPRISMYLNTADKTELRDWIAITVNGLGLKEAGHFLRNIGISDNQVAILDRHILRNLASHGAVSVREVKNAVQYKKAENEALTFSKNVGIPIDELDLLFWKVEHGKYFK